MAAVQKPDGVGLVLAGGGARGAYEAGALSVLLPALERDGTRPAVLVGTSVGALNAAHLASHAHLSAEEQTATLCDRWRTARWADGAGPVLRGHTALTAARYLAEVAGVPGIRLRGLLDSRPLARTLADWIDWDRLHANIGRGAPLDATAVVATSALSARSVVFVEGPEQSTLRASHEVDYVAARLGVDQVRASAAIPTIFPAVELHQPSAWSGWYFDGGTRLNTPVKPALDLGVERVALVATHPVAPTGPSNWQTPGRSPDFADGAVQLLMAALVDSLIADVRMLGKINLLIGSDGPRSDSGRDRRRSRPYRRVPHLLIAPPRRDTVGDLAHAVFEQHFSGLKGLRSPNVAAVARLVGGVTEPHAELLSYVFFEPLFAEALIEAGRGDAERWLDERRDRGSLWQTAPVDTGEA